MRIKSLLIATLICISVGGCRIIQVVPVGGDIVSRTGLNDCLEADTCILELDAGAEFGDTFTAVPKTGYRFAGWGLGLCQGQEGACVTEGIPGDFTALTLDVYLKPKFIRRQLNDTGLTFGGEATDGNNADCSGVGILAQDCASGRDVTHYDDRDGFAGFSFTRLDSQGRALPDAQQEWLCVRDNVTGLVWESRFVGTSKYFWNQIVQRIAAVNSEKLCGFNDWRAPTAKELESLLILPGQPVWHMDINYFYPPDTFWTKTRSSWNNGSEVFFVDFDFGRTVAGSIYSYLPLRLVRGGNIPAAQPSSCGSPYAATTPSSQFIDNADGTITDTTTNLMWKRCAEGHTQDTNCSPGSYPFYTWEQALNASTTLNGSTEFAGHSNWRLPNIKELRSIVEESCNHPSINSMIFPGTTEHGYWTSSIDGNAGAPDDDAWVVNFGLGTTSYHHRGGENKARLVRDLD